MKIFNLTDSAIKLPSGHSLRPGANEFDWPSHPPIDMSGVRRLEHAGFVSVDFSPKESKKISLEKKAIKKAESLSEKKRFEIQMEVGEAIVEDDKEVLSKLSDDKPVKPRRKRRSRKSK